MRKCAFIQIHYITNYSQKSIVKTKIRRFIQILPRFFIYFSLRDFKAKNQVKFVKEKFKIFSHFSFQKLTKQNSYAIMTLPNYIKKEDKKMFKLLANIIWFIFGGLILGLAWLFLGLLLCITIIGIPNGIVCLKLMKIAFCPFGSEVTKKS